MISKKEFLQAIKNIQEHNEMLDKLRKVAPTLTMGIVNLIENLQDTAIRLLELNCGLDPDIDYGTEISWWIYETNFGKKKSMNKIWIGKKKYILDTAEDLYDFITMDKKRKKK